MKNRRFDRPIPNSLPAPLMRAPARYQVLVHPVGSFFFCILPTAGCSNDFRGSGMTSGPGFETTRRKAVHEAT